MTYKFILQGEVPSKKNGRMVDRKSGRNFPSDAYREWHDRAALQLRAQECPSEPIEKCEGVYMLFHHKNKKRRDTNNQMASVFDLLVDCKILADDCWTVTGIEAGKGVLCDKGKDAWCEVGIEV